MPTSVAKKNNSLVHAAVSNKNPLKEELNSMFGKTLP
jgi:hypothetical protein